MSNHTIKLKKEGVFLTGIYCIQNLINNKVYIGQSIDVQDRLIHHKSELKHGRHHNTYLQRSWNIHGENNFVFFVLEECEEEKLDDLEHYYITLYDSMNRAKGYNRETGGHINKHMSKKSRMKMSESKKGMYAGEKNPMYGIHIPCSEEKKKKFSIMFSGKGNPMYGRSVKISDERKKEMSDKSKGKLNPFYGKKHSEESRRKISNSKKKTPVVCVETNVYYESCNKAGAETGIHSGSISRCCKNEKLTAGGYHWKYYIV